MLPIVSCTVIFAVLISTVAEPRHHADTEACSGKAEDQAVRGGVLTQTMTRKQIQQMSGRTPNQEEPRLRIGDKPTKADVAALFEVASLKTQTYSTASAVSAVGGVVGGFLGGMFGAFAATGWLSHAGRAVAAMVLGGLAGGFTGWTIDNCVVPAFGVQGSLDPVNTTVQDVLLDEPVLEKLRRFAEEVIAIADFEHNTTSNFKDLTQFDKDTKDAAHALADINQFAARKEQEGKFIEPQASKEPCEENPLSVVQEKNSASPASLEGSNDSFPSRIVPLGSLRWEYEKLVEILGHSDAAKFLSAEAARNNQALLTDRDLMMIEYGGRPEDDGTKNTTEHLRAIEGDIVVATEKDQNKKVIGGRPWTGGKVDYCISPDTPIRIRAMFEAVTRQFHKALPCLEFNNVGWKRGNSTSNIEEQECKKSPAIFLQSNPNEGCYSWVGMVTSKSSQRLQLQDPGCLAHGIAMHEIGHALGLVHEHSRSDRDSYIQVFWENIQSDAGESFEIVEDSNPSEKYELLSVMHFDNYAFGKERGAVTIEALTQQTHDVLGQRVALAKQDVLNLASFYKEEDETCLNNDLAGEGCINTPNTDSSSGGDVCASLVECKSREELDKCCACGGGIKVQCYKGEYCPSVALLPPPPAATCLESVTHMYPGKYACAFRNKCDYDVTFKCPDLECEHNVLKKSIGASYCGNQIQTQVCAGKCEVHKSSESWWR